MGTFDLMQEVIVLDGTSLVGMVIDKAYQNDNGELVVVYKVFINGSDGRWYRADELASAQPAASGTDVSMFDLIERRIMKSGDTRYLEGIDEPIGLETVRYINNQSIALHDAKKVAEAFAGTLDEKYQTIGTLKAELASVKAERDAAMLRVTNMRRVLRDVMNTSGDGNSVLGATEALELDDKTHAKALQADGEAWDDEHGGDYDDSVGGG